MGTSYTQPPPLPPGQTVHGLGKGLKWAGIGCGSILLLLLVFAMIAGIDSAIHERRLANDPNYKAEFEAKEKKRIEEAEARNKQRGERIRLEIEEKRKQQAAKAEAELLAYWNGDSARVAAFSASKQLVRKQLKAPASADFPWFDKSFVQHKGKGLFQVNAYVDAQNSFGAMLRNKYSCLMTSTGKDDWRGICGIEGGR